MAQSIYHTLSKLISNNASAVALISLSLSLPMSANAGFLDNLYDVQNTIYSIGRTADTIRGSKQAVVELGEEVGIVGQPQQSTATAGQIAAGTVLVGKLQNTTLYSQADKTSAATAVLTKQDVMIYMGSEQNGYYHVQSDKGEGWVSKPLVAVQY